MSAPLLPFPTEIVVCLRASHEGAVPSEYPMIARLLERGEVPLEDASAPYIRFDEVERRIALSTARVRKEASLTTANTLHEAMRQERKRIAQEILGPVGPVRTARLRSSDALALYGLALLESAEKNDPAATFVGERP